MRQGITSRYSIGFAVSGFIANRALRRGVLAVALLIAGTSAGIASPLDALLKTVSNAIPFNPFDTKGNAFNKLIDAQENQKAMEYFDENYATYFDERFNKKSNDVTSQLQTLGRWSYERTYGERSTEILSRLGVIPQLRDNASDSWGAANNSLDEAIKLVTDLGNDKLLTTSRMALTYQSTIQAEIDRVQNVAKKDRPLALATTFAEVFKAGQIDSHYPYQGFTETDYVVSGAFQMLIYNALSQAVGNDQIDMANRLARLTSNATAERVTREAKLRGLLARLGTGPYSLDSLKDLRTVFQEFGNESGLKGATKIGYIDLTAASAKDRHVFDFEIAFDRDYGLELLDAKESVMGKGAVSDYDFIFLTNLSAAKILREFKNKREVDSRTQTGSRQEPNPDYVTALSDYQAAMSSMQATKLQNAASANQPCYGSAIQCFLLGGLKGLADAGSENDFKRKAEVLSRTSQTVTAPVYSQYKYQLVDIGVAKLARVDYYVIDVKKRQVYTNFLEIKDNAQFTVAYNVEDADPESANILGKNQREAELTAWEQRPVSVKHSSLFDQSNIKQNPPRPFTTVDAFLKPLSNRQFASVGTNYESGTSSRPEAKVGIVAAEVATSTTVRYEQKSSSSRSESGVIADDRFDSVVVVKTNKGTGTGFYITPDLVMTAFHVVDGSNLVELTFYNGTKTYGKVIDSDIRLDLALIKPQISGKPVKIHTGQIRLGETTEAIGHPKGYDFTITRGVISALRKQAGPVLKSGPPIEFIQTDTPISPGNSGGPLFLKDSVIGVNDWVRVDKASQNLNFSVSFNEIREYMNRFEGKSK